MLQKEQFAQSRGADLTESRRQRCLGGQSRPCDFTAVGSVFEGLGSSVHYSQLLIFSFGNSITFVVKFTFFCFYHFYFENGTFLG